MKAGCHRTRLRSSPARMWLSLKTLIVPFERPKNYTHNMDNRIVAKVTASFVPSDRRFEDYLLNPFYFKL